MHKYNDYTAEDWYNICIERKMREEFTSRYGDSLNEVERLLNGNNFEDFCLACNYLNNSYGVDTLQNRTRLIDMANAKVRERIGSSIAKLYDDIVSRSNQELWLGDELYKLFSYGIPPYYVMECIKSALYINECMTNGVNTIQDCINIANYVYHPPYHEIYHADFELDFKARNIIRERECKAWNKIAEFLFNGDATSAVAFLRQECVRKE